MKIYVSNNQIPEFVNLTNDQISKIYVHYFWRTFMHWSQWTGLSVIALCILIWDFLARRLSLYFLISDKVELLLLFFFAGIGGFVYMEIVLNAIVYLYRKDSKKQVSRDR